MKIGFHKYINFFFMTNEYTLRVNTCLSVSITFLKQFS